MWANLQEVSLFSLPTNKLQIQLWRELQRREAPDALLQKLWDIIEEATVRVTTVQLAHKEGEEWAQWHDQSFIVRYKECETVAEDSRVELLYSGCEQSFWGDDAREGEGDNSAPIGDNGSSGVVNSYEIEIKEGKDLPNRSLINNSIRNHSHCIIAPYTIAPNIPWSHIAKIKIIITANTTTVMAFYNRVGLYWQLCKSSVVWLKVLLLQQWEIHLFQLI